MREQVPVQTMAAPESQGVSTEGQVMSPPTFQLKASSLMDLVSPVQMLAMNGPIVQRTSLNDFNNQDANNDPSHLTDAQIQGTDEYTTLSQTYYLIPTTDPSQLYTPAEITMACRLMVRAMREGQTVDPIADARTYLDRARMQLNTSEQAEASENNFAWGNQGQGMQLTEFGRWLLGGGPEPDAATGNMNCWEFVMFSAYQQGFVSKAALTTLYTDFNTNMTNSGGDVPGTFATMERAIQGSTPQPYVSGDPDSARPLTGDIVIFGGGMYQHVAIATGNMVTQGRNQHVEIMSLWTQNRGRVVRTTIEALNPGGNAIRFFSPAW